MATKNKWTDADDRILRAVYPIGGLDACEVALPERTHTAIYHRATVLKLVQTYTSLERAARMVLKSAQFSGERVEQMNVVQAWGDSHADSRCTVSLRTMLTLKGTLESVQLD
jgi:hypothetical protein